MPIRSARRCRCALRLQSALTQALLCRYAWAQSLGFCAAAPPILRAALSSSSRLSFCVTATRPEAVHSDLAGHTRPMASRAPCGPRSRGRLVIRRAVPSLCRLASLVPSFAEHRLQRWSGRRPSRRSCCAASRRSAARCRGRLATAVRPRRRVSVCRAQSVVDSSSNVRLKHRRTG